MDFNEYQEAAVLESPKNITVSAAAGSGKTQVLGERVLRRVTGENPVDVNRLLILTFTRSAAAEMRSRIGSAISDSLRKETDPDRRRQLERQSALLGGADICTIDSFCYRLLRQNFFKVPGLPGDFTVGDEDSVKNITAEALRDIVEIFSAALARRKGDELLPAYAKKADSFAAMFPDKDKADEVLEGFELLAMNYGSPKRTNDFTSQADTSDNTTDYVDYVYEIKDCIASCPDPDAWLDSCIADYRRPLNETAYSRMAAKLASNFKNDVLSTLRRELASLGNSKNISTYTLAIERLEALPEPTNYAEAYALIQSTPLMRLSVEGDDKNGRIGEPHAKMVMKNMQGIWKTQGKNHMLNYFLASPEEVDIYRAEIAPAITAVCELTRCLFREELKRCMEKKTISFSACVYLVLGLLTNDDGSPSETALELRELYDEIYVDEAQDIDLRQKAVFDAISKGKLFMVGDVKQSIYGFRYSEPEIFNARCSLGGENDKLITMNLNYRSNSSVIGAVNGVFRRLINESTMGTDYSRLHEMEHGESWLPEDNPKAEFIAVVDEDANSLKYDFRLEAQAVANRIKALIASGVPVYDKTTREYRPIMYKDIIILLRSMKGDGTKIKDALEKNRIPCFYDGGEGLYSKTEVALVTDLLTLIDNDGRDIPLAGVLRSVMFGFGENDLLKIRAVSPKKPFNAVFRALSTPEHRRHGEYGERLGDSALLARCLDFGEKLRRWRHAADFSPISEVINMIVTETDLYSSAGAMNKNSRANLDALIDAAAQFEAAGGGALFSFLEYVKKQNLSPRPSKLEAKTLSESMDVVRIMTIHKSKGLEAPVVIFTKCSSFRKNISKSWALSQHSGFSMNYINEEKGYFHNSPLSALIELHERYKDSGEMIRLLYVAMTRPRERLILSGYFPNQTSFNKISNFDSELSGSEAVFLANSFAKMTGEYATNGQLFDLTVLAREDVAPPEPPEVPEGEVFSEDAAESFGRLLGFDETAEASLIPAKVSVSALKAAPPDENITETELSRGEEYREPLRAPAFIEAEKELTAAELGTAYHTVMEHLDLSRPAAGQIDEMLERGIISEAEHRLIMADRVQLLLDSPLGQRMRRAKKLFREAPFMMNLPASELGILPDGDPSGGEAVAVQGIIDCFFIEDDRIVLVDYKTDHYTDPQNIVQKYEKQLNYYSKAINLKFCDKKIQKYLYLFYKGDIIEV